MKYNQTICEMTRNILFYHMPIIRESSFMKGIRSTLHYNNKTKQLETHAINWLGDRI